MMTMIKYKPVNKSAPFHFARIKETSDWLIYKHCKSKRSQFNIHQCFKY